MQMKSATKIYTAEMVGRGHPDKACDQFGDQLLDELLRLAGVLGYDPRGIRAAIEVSAKGYHIVVSGEIRAPDDVLEAFDIDGLLRHAWTSVGYPEAGKVEVINLLAPQSAEIGAMIDVGGAGDQGIMIAAAFTETHSRVPREYAMARDLIAALERERNGGYLDYLGSDAKSQVSVSAAGEVRSVIISTQHDTLITPEELRGDVFERVVVPVLGELDPARVKINQKGSFVEGGTIADAGVLGRKIVVDAFGPRVPVGGGAFSGKDPTKVDRCAAYQARQIARAILADGFADAQHVVVGLAFGIGQIQPEMVSAVTDTGHDVADWVHQHFPDLSPSAIQERLGLWQPDGWRYVETACAGHYGDERFPWERDQLDRR